jgi:hypothetical protein
MKPANGRNNEALNDSTAAKGAGRDLQAGNAGESERRYLIVKAAGEIAWQPGVQRDFQAE